MLDNVELLAELEVHDVGKPLKQARADAVALARYFEFYGGAGDKVHGETLPFADRLHRADAARAARRHRPHRALELPDADRRPQRRRGAGDGQRLRAQAGRGSLPDGARVRAHRAEAGLPAGALNVVTGLGDEAGAALSAHPGVDHLSFTGSVATGTLVQIAAAKNAVPVTLELGGKSPQIVFADADLDAALPFLVNAGIQNAGQTCSAASRILVERPVFEQVRAMMAERYRALRVGPAARDLDLGPVISGARRRRRPLPRPGPRQRPRARRRGRDRRRRAAAAATTCGRRWSTTSPPGHALAQDEIFGPVQVLIPFDGEAEAIRIANGTEVRPGRRRLDPRRRPRQCAWRGR